MNHRECTSNLAFFVAGSLPPAHMARVEQHITACELCAREVQEWTLLAAAVREETSAQPLALPPLSPVVLANLRPQPSLQQSISSSLQLILAQRALLMAEIVPFIMLSMVVLALLLNIGIHELQLVHLGLFGLFPLLPALAVSVFCMPRNDPACNIIAVTPTRPSTLFLARLTLLIVSCSLAGLLCSVLLAIRYGSALITLVGLWFGPMILLSSLSTVISLWWQPSVALSVTLTLWGSVVLLLGMELHGYPLVVFSLRRLLTPDLALVGLQAMLGLALYGVALAALRREHAGGAALEGEL